MHSLSLREPAAQGGGFMRTLTGAAQSWRRSNRAVGGYWLGSFSLGAEQLSRNELVDFFESYIDYVVQEHSAGGILTWEGIIQEMRLLLDGWEYMISLRPERWHNNVKVIYRSIVDGSRQTVAWSENTDSSDALGEMQLFLALPATTSAAATAMQTTHLKDYAWPRPRMVGGAAFPRTAGAAGDRLYVKCAGFWHTLNWLYQETSITDTADDLIGILVGNSEFVTAGRIETNALSTYIECSPNPRRIGDAITEIVSQGDASGNLWRCGVYADKKLIYEQAPEAVEYFVRTEGLIDKAGVQVHPELLEPGFLLYNSSAPVSAARPGTASAWDDPQIAYVEQIEFVAPDGLRLRLYDEEETIAILGEQIRAEIAMQPGKHPRWGR